MCVCVSVSRELRDGEGSLLWQIKCKERAMESWRRWKAKGIHGQTWDWRELDCSPTKSWEVFLSSYTLFSPPIQKLIVLVQIFYVFVFGKSQIMVLSTNLIWSLVVAFLLKQCFGDSKQLVCEWTEKNRVVILFIILLSSS